MDVIKGFRAGIDFSKLGYRLYKVDVVLKEHKNLPTIINLLLENPNFVCRDITLGHVDLELEFLLENVDELHQIMENITVQYPNTIRSYKYFTIVKAHKFKYIPSE